jgi:hypothetical protein
MYVQWDGTVRLSRYSVAIYLCNLPSFFSLYLYIIRSLHSLSNDGTVERSCLSFDWFHLRNYLTDFDGIWGPC